MQHGARQDLEMLVLRLKRAIVTGFTVNELKTCTENALREMKFCRERIASMRQLTSTGVKAAARGSSARRC